MKLSQKLLQKIPQKISQKLHCKTLSQKLFLKLHRTNGQATVEAAFTIPLLFIVMLLMIQPGIVMYDRMVMRAAASEGCRVLATLPSDQVNVCEEYVLRRLESVPQQSLFHEHAGGCSWKVAVEGSETSEQTSVEITNKIKPLPLIGQGAALLGMLDANGYLTISVSESYAVQPSWAAQSALGSGSSAWIGSWNES